ncbi:molybdopterin-dependent oxidoreductase [Microbacterium aureliae]
MERRRHVRFALLAAAAGAVAAASVLAVAELVALVVARPAGPLVAVGSVIVDGVPQPVKEFAIAAFGENDKIVLLVSVGVAALLAAAGAGILQLLRPPSGALVIAAGAVVAVTAAITRSGADASWALPGVVGGAAGVIVMTLLVGRLRRWRDAVGEPSAAAPSRRAFLTMAVVSAGAAILIGAGTRALTAVTASIEAIRDALRLPAPRSTVTIPAGAAFDDVPGLSPLITPNADFYRVDTALTLPEVDPATWRLRITGMVDSPFEIGFDDLVGRGLDEYSITLTCVSNEVGGGLVGNAVWQGVPVRDLLALASPQADADMVLSRSADGFTASTPLEALTDPGRDAILAVAMNGEPLPVEHGFPVRMVVPGLYGYVSATKWVTELTVTRFDRDEAYWTPRGYSAQAPIKMSSRLDTPRAGTAVDAGDVTLAGMAWAQTVGIDRVEVSVDDGPWQRAELSAPINDDTWVQWRMPWRAEPGTHYVVVRAVDREGRVQVRERAPIAPDGSTGWQRVLLTVR